MVTSKKKWDMWQWTTMQNVIMQNLTSNRIINQVNSTIMTNLKISMQTNGNKNIFFNLKHFNLNNKNFKFNYFLSINTRVNYPNCTWKGFFKYVPPNITYFWKLFPKYYIYFLKKEKLLKKTYRTISRFQKTHKISKTPKKPLNYCVFQ